MSNPSSLHFSEQFCISCGTVTVDQRARKILLISTRRSGEYMLPKGRKDVGESLEITAVRETYEETGLKCELLPHSFPTLATDPTHQDGVLSGGQLTREAFAVTQRYTAGGTLKIILWFLAKADSTVVREEGTQMDGEDFETVWVDEDKVVGTLTFENDQAIARRVIEEGFGMGLEAPQ